MYNKDKRQHTYIVLPCECTWVGRSETPREDDKVDDDDECWSVIWLRIYLYVEVKHTIEQANGWCSLFNTVHLTAAGTGSPYNKSSHNIFMLLR